MAPEENTGAAAPPRKVRSACRRCRQKRVKCDGGIPACSNCARAKVPCIDVHTGNNELSIPRDFTIKCCARIKWLEQHLGALCPDFDLAQGPQVNADFMETLSTSQDAATIPESTTELQRGTSNTLMNDSPPEETTVNKRSHSTMESDADSPLSAKARSVAIDLGMLSLQSDSRQKHYLGSSSGLLFTKLMGLDDELRPAQASRQTRRLAPLRISDEVYRTLYGRLKSELPPPDEACLLLEIYFQNIHIDQPFIHPASLVNAYQALYTCAQRGYDSSVDRNGWLHDLDIFSYNGKFDHFAGHNATPISIFTAVFHISMAFSLAATVLTRKKNYDFSPARFHRMAMSTASETFSNISVTSLQAILLLTVQSLIEPAGINVWTLTHIAISHCIDLGLHREPTEFEAPRDATTILRFIFYTVYSLDRSIATIQGRPLGIRDETFDIKPPDETDIAAMTRLTDSDLEIKVPISQLLALSICRFHLDQHISEIKLLLYHLPTRNHSFVWPTNLSEIQTRIKNELDQWLAGVHRIAPTGNMDDDDKVKLQFEKMRQEQLYHSAITLLFQPSQVFPSPSQEALTLCYQSCSKRLQIYDAVGTRDMLYYNWRNIHGIFSSGATIVYCAWVSREIQRTVPFAKLLRDLRTCSNHLSIGSQWWPSVRNGKESFETMIDLVIKYFSDLQLQVFPLSAHRRRLESNAQFLESQPPVFGAHDPDRDVQGYGVTQESQYSQSERPVFHNQNQQLETNGYQPLEPDLDSVLVDSLQDLNGSSIEAAMENFMAEFLHEDWGWDPFSSSTGAFDSGPGFP